MYLTRDEVRAIDRRAIEEYGVPSVVLMENAGRGVAELLLSLGVRGPVAVVCGKGNNGGDGFVIARHLDNHGVAVRLHLFYRPEALPGDAAINHAIVARGGPAMVVHSGDDFEETAFTRELASAEWVVDALFGTGLTGPARDPFDRIIRAVNAAPAKVLAVDIPSGLDCDTGEPLGSTVKANHTATFVAMKKGFANLASREWTGRVHVLGIGAPKRRIGVA